MLFRSATTTTDDSGSTTSWIGRFTVVGADRYQIELKGQNGLRNPNPGTYPIAALQDYAPVGRWLLPDDESGTLLLPEALLCMRGESHDDFGLAEAKLTIDGGKDRQRELVLASPSAQGELPKTLSFLELVELKPLLGDGKGAEGLSLWIHLADNREPKPNATDLPRRQVQIVDSAQLFAAIGRSFRALREDVEQSIDLQNDRRQRLSDLLADKPEPGLKTGQVLTSIEVGQGRIQSAAERLHRGAMKAFDLHLWNRLDPSPACAEVVQRYVAWHKAHTEPVTYQPAFYRELLQLRRQDRKSTRLNSSHSSVSRMPSSA